MAPLKVPPELKKITVFLRRAEELDRDKSSAESRVTAFNCRQYAVHAGIPLVDHSSPASKQCLGDILNQLEKEKEPMSVFSKEEHWAICRKVADRVFDKADTEDRDGLAGKGTAKTFYAAGTFYEILQQFYKKDGEEEDQETKERREEEEQRRVYCKWKATDILNAIKEGRNPTPGGYQRADEAAMTQPDDGGAPSAPPNPPTENELPPAPAMPSPDLFVSPPSPPPPPSPPAHDLNGHSDLLDKKEGFDDIPPPSYSGIELNLDGEPKPTSDSYSYSSHIVEDVNEGDEDSGTEDVFIPGALKSATEGLNEGQKHNDTPSSGASHPGQAYRPPLSNYHRPVAPPPSSTTAPSYQSSPSSVYTAKSAPTTAPKPASNGGMFQSLFARSSSTRTVSKEKMGDAIELTRFALAALQKGDGELGADRLQQALEVLRK